MTKFTRYSIITEKNPREIVLLRGNGCKWRRCRFCDYHLDFSTDIRANYELNKKELEKVTGRYAKLEVINSGSFVDLDPQTFHEILRTCLDRQIKELHFECHWMHKEAIPRLRNHFANYGITVKVKIGVETFDSSFRENCLDKGITADSASEIARHFDEACLLFGLPGQTEASMKNDIETGLAHFERICINIMNENTKPIKPDPDVIQTFLTKLHPLYREDPRIDILIGNTDFGVGGQ